MVSKFLRRPFVKNVVIVAGGTTAAQAITVIFSPLITRLYGPEAFGLLGVFKSLVMILTPVAALTYPIAIVLPQKDSDAEKLVKISLGMASLIFVIVTAVLLAGGERLLTLLKSERIAPYILLIPLCVFFAACTQVAQQWMIRKKQFAIAAKVTVLQSFLLNSAKAGAGLFKPGGGTLVILATVGQALNAVLLWLGIKRSQDFDEPASQKAPSDLSFRELAILHSDFPLYRAPQVFINVLSQSLPILMLASFFGPVSAGFYSICRTVLGMPSQLIGRAVGDVFYPRIAEGAHRGDDLSKLIIIATLALIVVGVVPFTVIAIFGPQLFAFVFGSN